MIRQGAVRMDGDRNRGQQASVGNRQQMRLFRSANEKFVELLLPNVLHDGQNFTMFTKNYS